MVNYTQLAWKLACKLRKYRKFDPTIGFSNYEFDNKLLVGVTFFRVISNVPWNPIFLNSMWILINLPLDCIIFIYFSYSQNFKVIKN